MLYDIFSFYEEKHLLELRINYLYDVVDKFVIIEGDRTYAGKPIPCFYDTIRKDFEQFSDKIVHIRIPLKANPVDRWENEAIQRDGFEEGLVNAQPEDLVLIGCVDEIPRKEVLEKYKRSKKNVLTLLELDNYYYYFNGKDVGSYNKFPSPVLTRVKNITEGTHKFWENRRYHKPHKLLKSEEEIDYKKYHLIAERDGKLYGITSESFNYPLTHNAGWHFSYTGGPAVIKKKLESFSHVEYDTDYHKDPKRIAKVMEQGDDMFDRNRHHQFEYLPITKDSDFPDYLINNKNKFREFIL